MKKQTPRVTQILHRAELVGDEWGHDFVGTEHLLLAITQDRDGIASRVLSDLGVSEEAARRVRAIIESDGYNKSSHDL
jgi:ATP-dependent Clp protease ATP-binding subunit ClpC